ncbi:hypothetical protein CDAR_411381 [Caerostris darwini]|uniref:Uncharacterized protein n=1 Tax=Caerostris darwini TaxID=1538125 RepID=A0AAV4SGE5_9ARAC|nr:hypothetical protein CDAR_411381 [Caerostris darwini]
MAPPRFAPETCGTERQIVSHSAIRPLKSILAERDCWISGGVIFKMPGIRKQHHYRHIFQDGKQTLAISAKTTLLISCLPFRARCQLRYWFVSLTFRLKRQLVIFKRFADPTLASFPM